jgi:hypothetical protein
MNISFANRRRSFSLLQFSLRPSTNPTLHELKVIVRPFGLGDKTMLIQSTGGPASFFKYILMIKSHKRNIKSFSAAKGFLRWLCPIKVTYRRFSVPGKSIKNSYLAED